MCKRIPRPEQIEKIREFRKTKTNDVISMVTLKNTFHTASFTDL